MLCFLLLPNEICCCCLGKVLPQWHADFTNTVVTLRSIWTSTATSEGRVRVANNSARAGPASRFMHDNSLINVHHRAQRTLRSSTDQLQLHHSRLQLIARARGGARQGCCQGTGRGPSRFFVKRYLCVYRESALAARRLRIINGLRDGR